MYGRGNNSYGQLGLGDKDNRETTEEIKALSGTAIRQLAVGHDHSLFLTAEGRVFGCGYNNYGQLGLGDTRDRQRPKEIKAFSGIKIQQMATGPCHSLFLTQDGRVFGCGNNICGRLGLGDSRERHVPEEIKALSGIGIRQIAVGCYHSLFLTVDGRVFGCGESGYGQLGDVARNQQILPKEINALSGIKIQQIIAGDQYSLFLTQDGQVFGCGTNVQRQLGLERTSERETLKLVNIPGCVVRIIGDGFFSLFVTKYEDKIRLYGCGILDLLGLKYTAVKFLGDLPEALFKAPAPVVQIPQKVEAPMSVAINKPR